VGAVIHSMGDSQDIRFIGGLSVYIPFSSSLMVPNSVLCGVPFLVGFYSKDFILELFSMRYVNMIGFLFIICFYGFNGLLFFPFVLFYAVILILLHLILWLKPAII
jgi:NADH-ubiquinone oxidoreductase chain 5